ncbi:hypothetical protein [Hymenobacter metallilatus]|uniref:Uncharacterized protein n=1 Tax=Hymenobacter metallilatus TaxID=2493666 RepID=A0A3R9LPT7_9BACT|nr:hypothetical protein [Hymenobacter metallilatus]RSK24739.1 hypothetical protein EI290_18960 [Hymenobacter metallilatus]
MAADYTDLLSLMGDVLRAVDRQTEENKKDLARLTTVVEQMGERMEQRMEQSDARFEAIFNRFAEAVADGFIRVEKKIDGVKEEVSELRTDVQHIDQRLERLEARPSTDPDVLRRLSVLEDIVLRKAS